MNKETVIKLAREAGFNINEKWQQISIDGYDYTKDMQRFAELVASAEREACALAVDSLMRTIFAWAQRVR